MWKDFNLQTPWSSVQYAFNLLGFWREKYVAFHILTYKIYFNRDFYFLVVLT